MMLTAVIGCSVRKTIPAAVSLDELPECDAVSLASEIKLRLISATPRLPARELYAGRTFAAMRDTAVAAGYELLIVSAGLGIVSGDMLIPSYDLNLERIIKRVAVTPTAWWRLIGSNINRDGVVVVALPRPYLHMVASSLRLIEPARLRIVAAPSFSFGDTQLDACILPYSTKLNGRDSMYRGTDSDFYARAFRHYINEIFSCVPYDEHISAVQYAMDAMTPEVRASRRSTDDTSILNMMRAEWGMRERSVTRMMLMLHTRGVACGRARVKKLYQHLERA